MLRRSLSPAGVSGCLLTVACLSLSALSTRCAVAAPHEDLITHLPGYGTPKTPHYSGYLRMPTGQGDVSLHYWLTTSQSETPEQDPVVLWMNGGPGASSIMFGFFGELGPYFLDDTSLRNTTQKGVPDVFDNPYAWNKIANILFLESPANVGYSYCSKPACRWDDTTGAEANYGALLQFFDTFPEYKENDFFITGESYGGMYVPSLVEQIHHGEPARRPNLKGFAVGNGIIGHQDTFPGANAVHYNMLHGHGFISEHQWAEVQSACGEEFKKPGKPTYSAQCQARLAEASDAAGKFYVYDIYDTCAGDQLMNAKAHAGGAEPLNVTLSRSHTTGTLQQLQKTYALGAAGGGPRGEPAYSPYGCGKNAVTQHWLNLPVVREAIHVRAPKGGAEPDYEGNTYKYWHADANNTGWNYNQSRAHLMDVYPEFIAHYRTLIFNGDFDACVPYLHNELWTAHLAEQQGWHASEEWAAWQVDEQVAGYVTRYSGSYNGTAKGAKPRHVNFTFATVKGSGHMVPQYQPKRGLELFRSFVTGKGPLY